MNLGLGTGDWGLGIGDWAWGTCFVNAGNELWLWHHHSPHRTRKPQPTVLYVGVGGGLEALQFAYFSRHAGAVIAVEPVAAIKPAEIIVTNSTWHYSGGGCC